MNKVNRCCLYFASSRLNRNIAKLAEEAFLPLGFSPTYAYLLMALYEHQSMTSKALAEELFITQSTLTRLVDKLVLQGYVKREHSGRSSILELTEKGVNIQEQIQKQWRKLYHAYSEIIGYDEGEALVKQLHHFSDQLENK